MEWRQLFVQASEPLPASIHRLVLLRFNLGKLPQKKASSKEEEKYAHSFFK